MLVDDTPEIASSYVNDQEWRDLGMDDFFAELDRTCGAPGQQMLYHRLRAPARTPDQFAALGEFESSAHRFSDDVSARERAQATLLSLSDSAAYTLPRMFLGSLPQKPRFAWLLPLLAIAPIIALAAALAGAAHAWVIVLALLCLNYVVRSMIAADVAWISQPIRALHVLLTVADRLAEGDRDALRPIDSARARLTRLRRLTSLTSLVEGGGDDVIRAFIDYFNLLFLIDINVYLIALSECERRRHDIRAVFEMVGDVDSALAVASFRAGRSEWCRPVILRAGSGIEARAMAHPMVPQARTNDVHIHPGHGIVITGSNMSGKTTLLRALGINTLLAQTINTCIATRFACPPLAIRSSIALADNLATGKSYYLVEATTALSMVHADDTVQHLFLLDELFRGTNTSERIAAGVAVMEALTGHANMAIVATHDMEVVRLVSERYEPLHFAESVTTAGFAFDFVLRPGPATQRNAISLLGVLGAPDSLLDRAAKLCVELEAGPTWANKMDG